MLHNSRTLSILAVCVRIPALALAVWALSSLPYPELDTFMRHEYSTRFYDRNNELLYISPLEGGLRREWLSLSEMPDGLPEIFIAAEDRNFYRHGGVDVRSALRALMQNLGSRQVVSGASTITMQLARMVSPAKRRTLASKCVEVWNALCIERRLSKDRILELYLNNLPFGFQSEGVASASRTFFAKPLSSLSPAAYCLLAVIPRNPSRYDIRRNPAAALERARDLALRAGLMISEADWQSALPEAGRRFEQPEGARHLVSHLINGLPSGYALGGISPSESRLGESSLGDSPALGELPAEVRLSIDGRLNSLIEKKLSQALRSASSSRIENAAALVIENRTGQVRAWVGNPDFFSASGGNIDGVLAGRQAGSAMKPFLYALALESGYAPAFVCADVPREFGSDAVYVPRNFNNRFNGPVLMRTALASSLNIPAVSLLDRLGIDAYAALLCRLGFASLSDEAVRRAGLSLALGGAEVSLLELVRAFSVFARDGKSLASLSVFEDREGRAGEQVFSPDTARIICDMLSDPHARFPGFGRSLNTPFPELFKTGTANQFQDIVALASTDAYTVGVWMGNFSGRTVVGKTGSSLPASLASSVLSYLSSPKAGSLYRRAEAFGSPADYEKRPVCALSGLAPGPYCPLLTEEFVWRTKEAEPCFWHRADGPHLPAEYEHWLRNADRAAGLQPTAMSVAADLQFSTSAPLSPAATAYASAAEQKRPNSALR